MSKETNPKNSGWINNYIKEMEERELKKQQMVSSTEYIDWLIKFTKEHRSFCDDDWLYFPEKISKEDRENVKVLYLFYDSILTYATKNYIYPSPCEFGNLYNIKYNNMGLEIGIMVGQGTTFFCAEKEIDEKTEFIDFNDIINDIRQPYAIKIDNELDNLTQLVNSLYEKGIPKETIQTMINETTSKLLNSKEQENQKVLKK